MIMKKGKKKRADATVGTISGGGGVDDTWALIQYKDVILPV